MKKVKTSVIMIKEVYFGKNINNHEVKVKIKKVHVSL
jgi:translation initiation factor IF-3